MSILDHAIIGETRLHIIVGDPITQVKSSCALTPMLHAQGHNDVVVPVHIDRNGLAQFLHASQQQILVNFLLGS